MSAAASATHQAEQANAAALRAFTALDPREVALLLDVDGTLIDIGPTPFAVDVSDTLKRSLERLFELTGGALALVSGRPIHDLDRLFAPLVLPAVGGHGAEMRLAEGTAASHVADLPAALRARLIGAVDPDSGVAYEDKGYSVALHYRRAPDHEARLRAHVSESLAAFPAEDTEVLPGKMMIEVKRPGIDKGAGIRRLMGHEPFARRIPVFIGDDVTDEAAFAAIPALGGRSFSVNRAFEGLSGIFSAPEQVRRALSEWAAKH
ncbi:trehalose-phosphatase [Undibacter mobilis]|uniref:trehalose-phosphatase n=1 Tax=Undibacter mobilis TaxID=2292256 RepID=UPI00143CF4FA|nr:trehalose-phosphatase [Undibacter mobilis]